MDVSSGPLTRAAVNRVGLNRSSLDLSSRVVPRNVH